MDEGTEELARRIRALERRERLYRACLWGGLAVLAGAIVAPGQAASPRPPAEVRAHRFVLVGADGAALAALEASPEGAPRLALMAKGGAPRLALSLAASGSSTIVLSDAAGRERVLLDTAGEDARVTVMGSGRSTVTLANGGIAPRLALADPAGIDRLWLALRLGSPALQFLDQRGVARSGLVTFNDEAGVGVISGTDRSSPGLVLYGKDRTIVWSAP